LCWTRTRINLARDLNKRTLPAAGELDLDALVDELGQVQHRLLAAPQPNPQQGRAMAKLRRPPMCRRRRKPAGTEDLQVRPAFSWAEAAEAEQGGARRRAEGKMRGRAGKRRAGGLYIPPAHACAQAASPPWPQSPTVSSSPSPEYVHSRAEDDDR
jgi:hypothetical protein